MNRLENQVLTAFVRPAGGRFVYDGMNGGGDCLRVTEETKHLSEEQKVALVLRWAEQREGHEIGCVIANNSKLDSDYSLDVARKIASLDEGKIDAFVEYAFQPFVREANVRPQGNIVDFYGTFMGNLGQIEGQKLNKVKRAIRSVFVRDGGRGARAFLREISASLKEEKPSAKKPQQKGNGWSISSLVPSWGNADKGTPLPVKKGKRTGGWKTLGYMGRENKS